MIYRFVNALYNYYQLNFKNKKLKIIIIKY